jgi:hypothetical protein
VLAELGFATRGTQVGKIRVDLTECGEDLPVRRAERIAVNSSGGYQRSSHVPVAKYHAERCVSFAAYQSDEFGEALRIEFAQEPIARGSQYGLAAKIEELKVQLSALERSRHRPSL